MTEDEEFEEEAAQPSGGLFTKPQASSHRKILKVRHVLSKSKITSKKRGKRGRKIGK